MPQKISDAVARPSSKTNRSFPRAANIKVRGVALDDADYGDLKLFMALDRRSLSFLVRDAIALYLRSRQEELQRLKNSNPEGKVQP
jgi:hypothetical protein